VISFLAQRTLHALLVLLLVSLITFGLIGASPSGPEVMIDPAATAQDREFMRKQLGLDQPLHVQYLRWAWGVLRGNLGRSFIDGGPVSQHILDRLPNTLLLTGFAFLLALVLSIPAGIYSAMKPYSAVDYIVSTFTFVGISIPSFWLGIMLIILFAVHWGVLPPGGMATIGAGFSVTDRFRHLLMPAASLGIYYMAELARYTRSAVVEIKLQDFVRTARAKGLTDSVIISRHIVRNALVPIITIVSLRLPRFVGGAAITEAVFAWPGMGRLAIEASFRRDFPVVLGITTVFAVVVVLSSLLADVLYGLADPRIQHGRSAA
jgi:peptide/nickel transport system permease protein